MTNVVPGFCLEKDVGVEYKRPKSLERFKSRSHLRGTSGAPVAMAAVRRRNHTHLINSWLFLRDPSPRLQIPAHINKIVAWYGRNSSTMTHRILSSINCALRFGQLFHFRPQPPELHVADTSPGRHLEGNPSLTAIQDVAIRTETSPLTWSMLLVLSVCQRKQGICKETVNVSIEAPIPPSALPVPESVRLLRLNGS